MAWVTWQQHRAQLLAGVGLLVALALAALSTHIPLWAAYRRDAVPGCLPPSARAGCDLIVTGFQQEFGAWATAVRGLGVLPALAGLFIGAPLLAREFEQGTYRVAWTQGITRRRWLLSKSALLALATVVGAGLASLLVMWWREPFDALQGRMDPSAFDIEGLVVPAYAVFALAVGVLAGLLLRRTVAAMTATLVVFTATRLIVLFFLRPHLMAPRHLTALPTETVRRAGDWVLGDTLVDAGGRQVSATREGSGDPARPSGQHRSRDLPRLTGMETAHLLPAGRPVLDVPAPRRRPLPHPLGGDHGARALARPPDARLMTDINRADMLRLGVAAAAGSRLAGGRKTATTEFLQPHPDWRIVFVNHALTNPFFVPAKYGSQDAASLLGVRARWTGSASSNVARDGQGDGAGDRRACCRDRGLADRSGGLQRADGARAQARDPGRLLQRRRRDGEHPARLYRSGQLPVRPRARRPRRQPRRRRRRLPVHRHAGSGEHPAAHRRGARRDPRLGQDDQRPCRRERRRRLGRAGEDRADLSRESRPAWALRRRRRLDRRGRRGDAASTGSMPAVSGPAGTTSSRRRSRRSPRATSTSRSTSSPTCRASCRFSSSSSTATATASSRPRTRTPASTSSPVRTSNRM